MIADESNSKCRAMLQENLTNWIEESFIYIQFPVKILPLDFWDKIQEEFLFKEMVILK